MTNEEKLKLSLSESLTALKMIATADAETHHLGLRLLAVSALHVADVIWKEDRQPSQEEVTAWAKGVVAKIAEAGKQALVQMPVSSNLPT